jgi:hypothetical protein
MPSFFAGFLVGGEEIALPSFLRTGWLATVCGILVRLITMQETLHGEG